MGNSLFYSACAGFAAGVLWRSFLWFNPYATLFIGADAAVFILFFSLFPKWRRGIPASLFILSFCVGILRFHLTDKPPPQVFLQNVGRTISLSGLVIEPPEEKSDTVGLVAEARYENAETKIRISAKNGAAYRYGDIISATGKLELPKDFLTPQDKEFDYRDYLRKEGIWFVMYDPKVSVVSRGGGNAIRRALFSLREKIAAALNRAIPEPESTLARGVALGERASMNDALRQALTATGLVYIVIISGYHVAAAARWIMALLGFLPKPWAGAGGIIAIFSYVLMTGAAAASIRAGIMAALAIIARLTGRMYGALRALIIAGTVMVFINPLTLAFNVSFELSFLATVAVICLTPHVEERLLWIPWKEVRGIAALSIAVYAFLLPFVLYKIGIWSLAALPANLLVGPLVPPTMIISFITGFAGLISPTPALLIGKIAAVLLWYELFIIGAFSKIPFAAFSVLGFPFALVFMIYGLFFYFLFRSEASRKTGLIIPIAAFALTLAGAGLFALQHYEANVAAKRALRALLIGDMPQAPELPFAPDPRTASTSCRIQGHLPDHSCTPGAIFENAAAEQICVRGYTDRVRNVSTDLRKKVFAEYGISYPQPRGTYEVDHLIPLALGGSNDIANLFPEAAEPIPGFHEKDVVEVYLQEEVCAGRVPLANAQRQIATDWLAVYDNLTAQEILRIKQKYGSR